MCLCVLKSPDLSSTPANPHRHQLLANCVQPDGSRRLVVDVGANFGYYTLMAASLGCRWAGAGKGGGALGLPAIIGGNGLGRAGWSPLFSYMKGRSMPGRAAVACRARIDGIVS